jgi:hypothetical protein
VEWYWQGKTEELGGKPVPVPHCLPQIPHGLTRARTRASAVRGRPLTTVMALTTRLLVPFRLFFVSFRFVLVSSLRLRTSYPTVTVSSPYHDSWPKCSQIFLKRPLHFPTYSHKQTSYWTCSCVEVDRRFRGTYCLRHQGNDSSTHLWNVGPLQRDYTALPPRIL